METNILEKAIEAITTIHNMNVECVEDFNYSYEECFPADAYRTVTINGKEYTMKLEISLKNV